MKKRWKIKDEQLKMKSGWSPYSGRTLKGTPILTIVRGQVVMEDRQIYEKAGHGKFQSRSKQVLA
jgi:dihydroorotase-like cyclic amidohydrolase